MAVGKSRTRVKKTTKGKKDANEKIIEGIENDEIIQGIVSELEEDGVNVEFRAIDIKSLPRLVVTELTLPELVDEAIGNKVTVRTTVIPDRERTDKFQWVIVCNCKEWRTPVEDSTSPRFECEHTAQYGDHLINLHDRVLQILGVDK